MKGRNTGPERVSEKTNPFGSVRARWAWTDPSIWTERMLTALERGVKGGRWYSLMDKVAKPAVLRSAFTDVKANRGAAGVDHQTIERFEHRLDEEIENLSRELKDGTYRPKPVKRVEIPKADRKGKRPLGIPAVRDRVVQGALRKALEPIFEREFAETSYGFRPGRGCKEALRRVDELLKKEHVWVVDADLKSYFDTIPHRPLLERIEEQVIDGKVLDLIGKYLKTDVMRGTERWTPERGSPQGAVVSPLLANIYLDRLDHEMEEAGYEMVRYADDFVIMCRSEAEAKRALELARRWCQGAGLTLHPEKTRLVDARERGGFDFLGYHFERGYRWPRESSLRKLKDAVRAKTKRANGHSLDDIIRRVNYTLRGWFEYFKHSHKTTFPRLDKWIRMRLRSILRKHHRGRGRGRGRDHQRWPNAFFAEHGLFSFVAAHAEASQSLAGTTDRRAGCGRSARPVRREGRPG